MSGPHNSAELAEAIGPTLDLFVKQSAAAIQRATDEIYERLLYGVQDYLKDNAEWNLGAEIDRCQKIEADNRDLRASQAELVEALREVTAELGEFADITINGVRDDRMGGMVDRARALLARIDGESA